MSFPAALPFPVLGDLVRLLLSPEGLGLPPPPFESVLPALERAAGRRGVARELCVSGDPREPARISAVFASAGHPRRRPTLVFLHGKGGSAAQWLRDATDALSLGFNVLLPSLRGHAPSTGSRITYGVLEKQDIRNLLAAAGSEFGCEPHAAGIDACSMGTLIALHYAAEFGARALWLQSPFGRLEEMAAHYIWRATGIPACLLKVPARLAMWRAESLTGLGLSEIDPVGAARKVTCPVTIVHGGSDDRVPAAFAVPIHEALSGPKELWLVPRCGHCHQASEPRALESAEYRRRWRSFWRSAFVRPEGERHPATRLRSERARRHRP